MAEDCIFITMGDFMKNAGIVGLYTILEESEAAEGIDYGVSEDGQALWLDREFAVQADWTDLYFQGFVECFEENTAYHGVLERIDQVLERISQNKWEANKKDKDDLTFISDKLLSNSIGAGFETIKAKIEQPEVYENLRKNKLKIQMEPEDIKKRLAELRSFLRQPLCRETFVMKGVVYNIINRFWDSKCFLLKTNAKKDMRQVYENDFSQPLRQFWLSDHKKAKELCIDCGALMGPKEKVSMAFIKGAGDDFARKQSSFANCKVDMFLCPACAFIYSLSPLGFQLLGNRFFFVNMNDSINNLLRTRNRKKTEREDNERLSSWFARMMNLILEEKNRSLGNIQVILKSRDAEEQYLFQVINKEILNILRDDGIKKRLKYLEQRPVWKVGQEYLNVYEETVFHILQYKKMYGLVNRLLKESLDSNAAATEIPASWVYCIELRRRAIEKGEEGVKLMKLYALSNSGDELRKQLELKGKKNIDGVVYQLLNALAVNKYQKFFDIVLRLYSSCQLPVPGDFVKMIGDTEKFQAGGYAFVMGLQGSNSWKDKKQKDQIGQTNQSDENIQEGL